MDLRRLRAGEWVTAMAGLILLVSLWTPWYARPGEATDASAWEALAVIDIVLALVAAGAVGLWLITAAQRLPGIPLAYSAFLGLAALAACVLVLIRVADMPGGASGREWGLWLGLAGAVGIFVGSMLSMHDERPARPGQYTDLTGAPAPEPPPVETLPAPRPEGES